jgi:hypothetical protein
MDLERKFLNSGCMHAVSQPKRDQIMKIMYFNNKPFDDIFILRTQYSDSICSIIQEKYIDILFKDTKRKFKEFGYFVLRKPYINCFSKKELKQIKINTYKKLFDFYNQCLVPMLQTASEKVDIISIVNFKFKPLKDRSHLII